MGVDRTDYIIYGYKLPYELRNESGEIDLYSNKFMPLIEGWKGEEFSFISDGMGGDYNVFGLLLKSSEEAGGWDFTNLNFENLDAEKIKSKYKDLFGLEPNSSVPDPYLFIFSHYS